MTVRELNVTPLSGKGVRGSTNGLSPADPTSTIRVTTRSQVRRYDREPDDTIARPISRCSRPSALLIPHRHARRPRRSSATNYFVGEKPFIQTSLHTFRDVPHRLLLMLLSHLLPFRGRRLACAPVLR